MGIIESIVVAFLLSTGALQMGAQIDVKIRSRFLGTMVMFTLVNTVFFVLGWGIALLLEGFLEGFQGLIASVILIVLGVKTLMRRKQTNVPYQVDKIKELFVLAVAGGIDVLLGGLSVALLDAKFAYPTISILLFSWFMSVRGLVVREKRAPEKQLTFVFVSGLILTLAGLYFFLQANNLIQI